MRKLVVGEYAKAKLKIIYSKYYKHSNLVPFLFWADLDVSVKLLLIINGEKRNGGARKMNLFTSLVELWLYDSRNIFCKKEKSFFENLYGHGGFSAKNFYKFAQLS